MVRDTSLLHSLVTHASRPPVMQRATLISNSMRTVLRPGALRWVGRVLADEAKRSSKSRRISSFNLC